MFCTSQRSISSYLRKQGMTAKLATKCAKDIVNSKADSDSITIWRTPKQKIGYNIKYNNNNPTNSRYFANGYNVYVEVWI